MSPSSFFLPRFFAPSSFVPANPAWPAPRSRESPYQSISLFASSRASMMERAISLLIVSAGFSGGSFVEEGGRLGVGFLPLPLLALGGILLH